MTKHEFLSALRERLSGLQAEDVDATVAYYREMIEDRVEDGLTEEEAVAALGPLEDVLASVLSDLPPMRSERAEPKRSKRSGSGWIVLLLVLGAPIWMSLLIAAAAVVLSVCIALGAVVLSLYTVLVAFAAVAASGIAAVFPLAFSGNIAQGLLLLGTGLVFAGLTILWFFPCKLCAKGLFYLVKAPFLWWKRRSTRKEVAA